MISETIKYIDFQMSINVNNSSENFWLRLLIREWAQLCIFLYIGYVWIAQSLKSDLHEIILVATSE